VVQVSLLFYFGKYFNTKVRVYHFDIIDYISVYYNVEITRRSKPMWQITAMVGNRQLTYTHDIMQLHVYYFTIILVLIIYLMIQDTIQYTIHVIIASLLYTYEIQFNTLYMS